MYRENTHQAGLPDPAIIPADTPIKKAATEYLAAGFALTNVDGKRPTAKGWNKRSKAITSTDQLNRVTGNIGLLHAYSGTCCIDVDDYQATDGYFADNGLDLLQLLAADDAVQIDSGRPNRAKLLYRTAETLPIFKHVDAGKTVVEFRCADAGGNSVQDVLPPSIHPDTGKPYKWIGNWKKLPFLPTALADFWKKKTAFVIPKDEKTHRRNITSVGVPITSMGVSVQTPQIDSIKTKTDPRRLFQTKSIQRQILTFLGFTDFDALFKTGRATVRSVVPPYDHNKSGGLILASSGEILFQDFSGACGDKHIPLQVLYARLIAGHFVRLTPTEKESRKYGAVTFAVWGVRLLVDAGIVKPAAVDLPPCPNLRKSVKQYYAGMKRLFEVRWAFTEHSGNPIAMGRDFMANWCGLTKQQARDAIIDLLKAGVIHTAGKHGRARLFAPGFKPPQKQVSK
jgi:hypothetical protein